MQSLAGPVRRHLPAATRRIVSRTDGLQQLIFHCIAQREAKRTVAVVREEPVVARLERHTCGYQKRLVPGARDLKEDLLLPLEQNFAIVRAPRQVHQAIEFHELLG